MHHSAPEPRPLTGRHTGQRADENSHPMCHVNALDAAPHHASAHQEGNGDADVNWREKPADQGRFAVVGQTAVARISAVCVSTRGWIKGFALQEPRLCPSQPRHEHRPCSAFAP
jgi:hypothetical protein